MLQADKRLECNDLAELSGVQLSDEFTDDVISEIKKLWPECRMICGLPRYSKLNGGVEYTNCLVENKLGA